jgi:hypothetical protein
VNDNPPPRRRSVSRGFAIAGLALAASLGVAALVGVWTHRAKTPPRGPAIGSAQQCETARTQYLRALAMQQTCVQDSDCISESRAGLYSGLDRCARFRRKDSSPNDLGQLRHLEQSWLGLGCANKFLQCQEQRAQCKQGTCAELPPAGLPRTYVRTWSDDDFSFFLPPDAVDTHAQGDDSRVARYTSAKGTLAYDFGRYGNPLNPTGDGSTQGTKLLSRIPFDLLGHPAFLSSMEHARGFGYGARYTMGVYVPAAQTSRPGLGGAETSSLSMTVTCDILPDCQSFEPVFRNVEFHWTRGPGAHE